MIRTLLIDHRDSFTQNLAHDLATVFGTAPTIVEHDDPYLELSMLQNFDCVVLSPGPGDPAEPADFGFDMRVLRESTLPVLGICLGHQGLALAHGGEVSRAPEPVHGRLDAVHHDGTGLFASLPSPLPMVRYHSLAVTKVPSVLRVTARTSDGVVMGLEHRTLPQWGVQFHPESICSERGRDVLARFRDEVLARMDERSGTEAVADQNDAPASGNAAQGLKEHRLHVRTLTTELDDQSLFHTLFGREDRAVWLDGNDTNANARFSIMGSGDTLALTDVAAGTVAVETDSGVTTSGQEFFSWLEADLAGRRLAGGSVDSRMLDEMGLAAALPFGFRPGWVGYLGYELKGQLGSSNRHRSDLPDAALLFATRALVVDHQTDTVYLLQLDGDPNGSAAWLRSAQRTLAHAAQKAVDPGGRGTAVGHETADLRPTVHAREGHDAYIAKVRSAQELIAAGETYELCLTTQLSAPGSPDPWGTYLRLREQAPAPFGSYVRLPATERTPALAVLSTSPERFLRVDAQGRAESSPIKGTRPRGATREEDDALREDLATHPKDRAENLMIADLVRHDLGVTAATGSVRVEELFGVHTFSRAHQMITTVSSTLATGFSSVACLREAFPPGSMTGAPKHRTMELIDALESGPRGVYSGALGWFGVDGALDTSVVIRTVVMARDELRYGTGGAIVTLSDPEDEYQETMVKAGPLLSLLGVDSAGEQP